MPPRSEAIWRRLVVSPTSRRTLQTHSFLPAVEPGVQLQGDTRRVGEETQSNFAELRDSLTGSVARSEIPSSNSSRVSCSRAVFCAALATQQTCHTRDLCAVGFVAGVVLAPVVLPRAPGFTTRYASGPAGISVQPDGALDADGWRDLLACGG